MLATVTNSLFRDTLIAQSYRTVDVDQRLELARWSPDTALLVGGLLTLLGGYFVYWLYRHEKRGNMSAKMRWSLTGLRLAVLMLLGFVGLEPVLVRYEDRRLDARTLVLVDRSASMDLQDHYRQEADRSRATEVAGSLPADGLKRLSVAEELLAGDAAAMIDGLAKSNDVTVFGFDRSLEPLRQQTQSESDDESDVKANEPLKLVTASGGGATDFGHAVRRALEALGDVPLAGLVVLTDGGFNRGEPLSEVARLLKGRRIATHVVGVGDPADPINVRVASVTAPRSVFKNDPFSITVNLEQQGDVTEPLHVTLYERRGEQGNEELVAERDVTPTDTASIDPVVIEREVDKPGEVAYRVAVRPISTESILTDNERELTPRVQVLDDQLKVLLVAGAPSYDYRYLMRLLERDETVELSTWLQSADINAVRDGNVVITELPSGTEKLNAFDAIILMDIDPSSLDPTWASVLATYVSDYGGGVMFAAGNKYSGQFFRSPKTRPLVSILPVVPDPEAEIIINELGHFQTKAWPIVVPSEAAGDPILDQGVRAQLTPDIWGGLGGLFWHFPVRREKPVAKALMRHSNPRMVNAYGGHVLLATQYVGAGRSAYLGINTTWRWRQSDEKPFNRFWIQLIRFLVEGKLAGSRALGQIDTDRDLYETGDTVVVSARLLDERYQPLLLPEARLKVTARGDTDETEDAGLQEIMLSPVPGTEGQYEGRFQARSTGAYRLAIERRDDLQPIEREIYVEPSNLEMRDTQMRRDELKAFVQQVGGESRYFDVNEAAEIPSLIPDASRTTRFRGRSRPIWDNGYVLAVLIGLLCIEWALRKVARLI